MVKALQPLSQPKWRFVTTVIVSLALLIALLILHIGIGSVYISPKAVVYAMINRPVEGYQREIVWNLRLPRALIALCAGGMLGMAGAIMQALTRNPLAEPGVTGVSAGSIFGITLWLAYFPDATKYEGTIPFAALLGGITAVLMMYLLTSRMKNGPLVLILKGLILSAILTSCSSLVLIQHQRQISSVMLWMVGSLNAKVWDDWFTIWPWALVSIPLGLACSRIANLLHLGDEVPIGLGVHLQRSRMLLFLVSALLTAGAVAVAGAIGFIGLIGPHVARKFVGHDSFRVLPVSALLAACLLLFADLLAQSVAPHYKGTGGGLPVGAVTAMLGAPLFLYLVWRRKQLK